MSAPSSPVGALERPEGWSHSGHGEITEGRPQRKSGFAHFKGATTEEGSPGRCIWLLPGMKANYEIGGQSDAESSRMDAKQSAVVKDASSSW